MVKISNNILGIVYVIFLSMSSLHVSSLLGMVQHFWHLFSGVFPCYWYKSFTINYMDITNLKSLVLQLVMWQVYWTVIIFIWFLKLSFGEDSLIQQDIKFHYHDVICLPLLWLIVCFYPVATLGSYKNFILPFFKKNRHRQELLWKNESKWVSSL